MRRALVPILVVALACVATASHAAQQDVTGRLTIRPSGFSLDRSSGTFASQVRILNTSSSILTEPLWFVISDLPAGVSVAEGSGFTVGGLPYVQAPLPSGGLAPGGQVSVIVRLNNPQGLRVNPRYSVLAEISGQGLPPDPGPAGDATVAGIDANNNGVRDDIERYIAFTYPNSQRLQKALQNLAIGYQAALLSTTSDDVFRAATAIHRAQDCLFAVAGDSGNDIRKRLRAEFLNTWDRTRAYDAYDVQLKGASFAVPPLAEMPSHCGFDPNSLPN